jgi:hypothetical protein
MVCVSQTIVLCSSMLLLQLLLLLRTLQSVVRCKQMTQWCVSFLTSTATPVVCADQSPRHCPATAACRPPPTHIHTHNYTEFKCGTALDPWWPLLPSNCAALNGWKTSGPLLVLGSQVRA